MPLSIRSIGSYRLFGIWLGVYICWLSHCFLFLVFALELSDYLVVTIKRTELVLVRYLSRRLFYIFGIETTQGVTECRRQTLGTSSTYQNKKKESLRACVRKQFVSYSWKTTLIISAQNFLHEIQCTPRHVSSRTGVAAVSLIFTTTTSGRREILMV
jgi:hypothetical protein